MNNARDLYLFRRQDGYIPRIAAVHDLCGYGKCSLGVAIPVLSAAGCDVCPVPTSLFSAHTRFPKWYMHDTTDMLDAYLDAWVEEGIELDAVYSGFLGAPEQVGAIKRLYREHPQALRIVDPVMGDGGKRYPTYTPELCEAMAALVDGADVLTPNLTEASILTGIPYEGQDVDDAYVRRNIDALLEHGREGRRPQGRRPRRRHHPQLRGRRGRGVRRGLERAAALHAARHGRPLRQLAARRHHVRQVALRRRRVCRPLVRDAMRITQRAARLRGARRELREPRWARSPPCWDRPVTAEASRRWDRPRCPPCGWAAAGTAP